LLTTAPPTRGRLGAYAKTVRSKGEDIEWDDHEEDSRRFESALEQEISLGKSDREWLVFPEIQNDAPRYELPGRVRKHPRRLDERTPE
jgi:hypothetical protein